MLLFVIHLSIHTPIISCYCLAAAVSLLTSLLQSRIEKKCSERKRKKRMIWKIIYSVWINVASTLAPSMCIMCWMFICLFTFSCRHSVAELIFSTHTHIRIHSHDGSWYSWKQRTSSLNFIVYFRNILPLCHSVLLLYVFRVVHYMSKYNIYTEKRKAKTSISLSIHGSLKQSVVIVTVHCNFMYNCNFSPL